MNGFLFQIIVVALLVVTAAPGFTDELDSLLSGFDEESSAEQENSTPPELQDLLEGFEDSEQTASDSEAVPVSIIPQWLTLSGSLGLQSTINFSQSAPEMNQPDYRGLSMFRGIAELIGDVSYSRLKGRLGISMFHDVGYALNDQKELYSDEFLENYENEIELNEAYFQFDLTPNLDLKTGRQIVVWGKSDNIRVTDILNPLDMRWPGLVDIRFLRLPVTMTKLDYYHGNWNVGAIVIHEPRFNKLPVYNGEFFPFNSSLPDPEKVDISWSNQQLALSLNGIFSGWDLSLYTGYVFDKQPYFSNLEKLQRQYERVFFIGGAVNVAVGNWLIKGEAAIWDGLKYANAEDEKTRFDMLIGFEYAGFSNTSISFEFGNRHIFELDDQLLLSPDSQKEDWNQFACRYVRDFLNDTLHLTLLFSSYGMFAEEGGFERFQLEYDLTDSIKLTGGAVLYQSGDFPSFKDMGDNDRILFEFEYRF